MPSHANAGAPPRPDLVIIGASAGGLEPLTTIVAGLPADLPATIVVVMHISPTNRSLLPAILDRATLMSADAAAEGMPLTHGRIYVAPPDRHVLFADGRLSLSRGPRENGHRPAVDPTLRSAAERFPWRTVGIILSGSRDDGTAGLATLKAKGGHAFVQDPETAMYPSMPANALAHVAVDGVLAPDQLAEALFRLIATGEPPARKTAVASAPASSSLDPPINLICPECGGALEVIDEQGVPRFRCHVGHVYSPSSMLDAQQQTVEAALWTAVRSLEDRASLLRGLADRAERQQRVQSGARFRRSGDLAAEQAKLVREALVDGALALTRTEAEASAAEELALEENR